MDFWNAILDVLKDFFSSTFWGWFFDDSQLQGRVPAIFSRVVTQRVGDKKFHVENRESRCSVEIFGDLWHVISYLNRTAFWTMKKIETAFAQNLYPNSGFLTCPRFQYLRGILGESYLALCHMYLQVGRPKLQWFIFSLNYLGGTSSADDPAPNTTLSRLIQSPYPAEMDWKPWWWPLFSCGIPMKQMSTNDLWWALVLGV